MLSRRILRDEGVVVEKKRAYRLYTQEGLQVRTKKRRSHIAQVAAGETDGRPLALTNGFRFGLANGGEFRVLNVVDDFLREMVGQLFSVLVVWMRWHS